MTNSDKIPTISKSEIDTSIRTPIDFFNARMTSIQVLKKEIDEDLSIENKQYYLADFLIRRFRHLKEVLYPQKKLELENVAAEQRAIQVYLQNLADTLRIEEREKLRIADLSYKPTPPRVIKPPQIKRSKIDKVELKRLAGELGVAEYNLQMVAISKGVSINEAAEVIRTMLEAAKKESKGE